MMTPREQEYVLDSIVIIVDTREQPTEKFKERMKEIKYEYRRKCLKFGDYTAEYKIGDTVYSLENECVIERKMGIDEICSNFTRGRKRFEREFERAKASGAKVHLIIENGSYEKILRGEYRSMLSPNSLISSLIAFCDRYNLTIHFCEPKSTPMLIRKIFYHHVRNKLLNEQN